MNTLCVLWAQYGPYHFARAGALQRLHEPGRVHAVEIASRTGDYAWSRATHGLQLHTLCENSVAEGVSFTRVFFEARRKLSELQVEVCFLPSYAPKQSLAAVLAAKSLGLKTVMMNESHAGTARATGLSAWIKRRLIGLFDAALVGGTPQKRYFASMGLPAEKIFTGYDAVDNDYFARRAEEARGQRSEVRGQYGLPEHYFLSLGRFVAKKNLGTLIRAYREFLNASSLRQTHLVMVGSGEEEPILRALCTGLQLPIYDHSTLHAPRSTLRPDAPGVHFYGFRQIDENPVFYALAEAFILPSLYEEWGLVVNEAMASGLPVVVSETAGCAEDLLEPGWPPMPDPSAPELLRCLGRVKGRLRKNGFVFDPQSPQALAAVLQALESVPALQCAMGQASRRIVEKFSCRAFAENALNAMRAVRMPQEVIAAPRSL
jgi:glycosyltransferase involved in cell wall biosynthesis